MTELERLQREIAASTSEGQKQIQSDNEEAGVAPGNLSPAAEEAGEKIADTLTPIQRQMSRELNKTTQQNEYSRYPDTTYYLSKSFWTHGGNMKDVLHTPSNDAYIK